MHTIGQATDFIERVFGDYKSSNAGLNVSVSCPICSSKNQRNDKKKLVIRTDNWWLHCWVCGYKNKTIYYLIKTYHPEFLNEYVNNFCDGTIPFLKDEDEELEKNNSLELPMGFNLLSENFENPKNIIAREAKKYLLSRGATRKDFWYFKYGITTFEKKFKYRVIIPSFDSSGKLNYFTSRAVIPVYRGNKYNDSLTSKEEIVFNEINIDWNEELTITEGPFDLLKCNDNATCLLGSALSKNSRLFQEIIKNDTPVLLALDNDAKKKQLEISKSLAEYGIRVRMYQIPKHLNDVGEMKKEDFIENMKNSIDYHIEDDIKYRLNLL